MNKRPTSKELHLEFLKSVDTVNEDIKNKMKELKKNDDLSEDTQLHYTLRILQQWFNLKGGLPI